MKTYNTISEIKAANDEIKNHFFDKSTINFFNSRILNAVYRGVYFITSEQHRDEDPREFTVRICINGSIDTIGKFQQFSTAKEARAFIKSLPEFLPQAYEKATNEFNQKDKSGTMDFVSSALIEPTNNDGNYSLESYTGACTWLIKNYEQIGASFIKYFEEIYNERITRTA